MSSSAAAAMAATSSALKAATGIPSFRYLSAWFCPYAHRATLALEHHKDRVHYDWVEALGWEIRKGKDANDDGEWYYHWKADELKRANPSALVPTLIPIGNDGQPDESKSVYESLVVIDFIDQISGASGMDRLVPEDPYEAARCRRWCDRANRECCSPYYGVLVPRDDEQRKAHFESLLQGIRDFAKEVSTTPGPLFLANGQLSNVDMALFPWAFRYYVLEHYRGPEFAIPKTPDYQPFHEWYQAMLDTTSVQRTLPDRDKYLEHIANYANGTARSKVANAVRRGAAAHELDDRKD